MATEAIFLVLLPLMASRKHSFGKEKSHNTIIRERKASFYITQRKKKMTFYSNTRTTERIYTYGWSICFAGHESIGQNH